MKNFPYGKGYTTCLCFLIECPNYLNQFCTVLLAALSCKKELFLNTEIFYKISENYWWGNCPTCFTGFDTPDIAAQYSAARKERSGITSADNNVHQQEKAASIKQDGGII